MIRTMTIKEAMASSSLPRLEVRMLLEAVLNKPRTWLIAHDDEMLTEQQAQVFFIMVARRTAGVPMAYLLGTREFMGLTFCVSPHVLIPRPDTETVVNKAIEVIREHVLTKVLDLGTGSGAIAISIAKACPDIQVDATDSSAEALGVAQLNAACLGVQVNWFQGDWYQALGDQAKRYDLIVSNPPYIHCDDVHLTQGDLRFEPPHALTDGADGLSALKIIIQQAPNWLKLKGQLWVEHGYDQADEVLQMFTQAGFKGVKTLYDLGEKPRATGGYLAVNL
jgi:release factor glutamine methyltransferase